MTRLLGTGLALLLACLMAEAAMAETVTTPAAPAETQITAPLYADHFDLLMYLDADGTKHPVRDAADWAKRREHILANMEQVMGPRPDGTKRVPLDITEESVEELEKVIRKKIWYTSEAGHKVPAYLLIPKGITAPVPAMLCLHGTNGHDGKLAGLHEGDSPTALELAQRGYVAITPDYPTFGGNQINPAEMGYVSGTMKGIWDHMRAVDVLQSLPEVDAQRIGTIGNSLGGHNSLFVAVFDERIKAIVCSSGFDSYLDYLDGNLGGWCQPCYMPRIDTVYGKDPKALPFDFPEVLAVLAPRPLFINAPLRDGNFKAASVDKCVASALKVYNIFDAEAAVTVVHPDAPHGFQPEVREQAYKFLDDVLKKEPPETAAP